MIVYEARKFAEEHHEGLTDIYGHPAISHIERVVERVLHAPHGVPLYLYLKHLRPQPRRWRTRETVAVAYLHDIVEDTSVTVDDVSSMFGELIGSAVAAITRCSETYADYIYRLKASPCPYKTPSSSSIAVTVKRADLLDHLEGPTPCPTSLVKRYEKALTALAEE